MIDHNSPIALEQIENGFVVRSLSAARENSLPRQESRAFSDVKELIAWLADHFKTRTCPECGRVMGRSKYWSISRGDAFVSCDRCGVIMPEGYTKGWVTLKRGEPISEEIAKQLESMAQEAYEDRYRVMSG